MVEERRAGLHRILRVAEGRQAGADEMVERFQRIAPRHRPAETLEIAEMVAEPGLDERDHG